MVLSVDVIREDRFWVWGLVGADLGIVSGRRGKSGLGMVGEGLMRAFGMVHGADLGWSDGGRGDGFWVGVDYGGG